MKRRRNYRDYGRDYDCDYNHDYASDYRREDDLDRGPLRLDTRHKKIGGVCGGIANYIGWSRTTVRVLAVVSLFFMPQITVPGYIIAYLIMDGDRTNARFAE